MLRREGKPSRTVTTLSPTADTAVVSAAWAGARGHDGAVTSLLETATDRLAATVAALPDEQWDRPSLCEGWTRTHVLAHLALNAEALAGVLRGVERGRPVTMYVSDEARDADIADLAARAPAEVRRRLAAAESELAAAITAVGTVGHDLTFDRTPGGQVMPVHVVPGLRLREVEIHHADLDAGYTYADWPAATALKFLRADARRHTGPGFRLRIEEPGYEEIECGRPEPGAPTVTGPLRALAWWATGRDPGAVLSSTEPDLPTMEKR